MEEKEKQVRMKPVVDIGRCTDCGSCIAVCDQVFYKNEESGYVGVRTFSEYPEDCVQEAISVCPEDCIEWEEIE